MLQMLHTRTRNTGMKWKQQQISFLLFRFFLQEIQNGETLIASGDIERGVEHLANAVVVCGQPAQLLQVLQQTLPAQVFTLLIQRMRTIGNPSDTGNGRLVEDASDDLE